MMRRLMVADQSYGTSGAAGRTEPSTVGAKGSKL